MIRRRRLDRFLATVVLLALPCAVGRADDRSAAEAAIASGAVRPVRELLERVHAAHAGDVLKMELEEEDDGPAPWIYEVKLLTPQGDVLELEYDAATLELIRIEGHHRGHEDD